jgi:hypothetical protein
MPPLTSFGRHDDLLSGRYKMQTKKGRPLEAPLFFYSANAVCFLFHNNFTYFASVLDDCYALRSRNGLIG